jgi:hypothetical protein
MCALGGNQTLAPARISSSAWLGLLGLPPPIAKPQPMSVVVGQITWVQWATFIKLPSRVTWGNSRARNHALDRPALHHRVGRPAEVMLKQDSALAAR